MKVGDYVRNKYGIAKVVDILKKKNIDTIIFDKDICFWIDIETGERVKDKQFFNTLPVDKNIDLKRLESSSNIIRLIKVGDYVNGYKVIKIDINEEKNRWAIILDNMLPKYLTADDINSVAPIKSIVTKEQFESMEYKVGE